MRKKKDNIITIENKEQVKLEGSFEIIGNYNESVNDSAVEASGDRARDLILLVSKAIEEWAKMYDMEKMPNHIIFNQALGIMNAWSEVYKDLKK